VDNLRIRACAAALRPGFSSTPSLATGTATALSERAHEAGSTKMRLVFAAQLLLFSQNHFGNVYPGIELKCFSEVIGAVRGVQ